MLSIKKQRGLSGIGWLFVLCLIGFFVLMGLKMAPVYMEHYTIKTALESLEREPFIGQKPVSAIRKLFMRRLDINYVTNIKKDHIKIKRSGGSTTIDVNYEVREHLFANLDVVMTFSESIMLNTN
ncbi:DUF4845 domain-containing protein [bacterium endosymbiont of Escarpia laminata]|nr:MAG: DUF4845 domain-containing protein [bacterium endosymbiont of Escarpia laminata]RLJ18388.1 MAG: DUF4845 domain-containing protein [bacterium endosymbiont of Escarpia laminata]